MSDQKSMGDLFRQRRAAAAAAQGRTVSSGNNAPQPTTGSSQQQGQGQLQGLGQQGQGQVGGGSSSSSANKKSFADIQREQQMEQRRQREVGGLRPSSGGQQGRSTGGGQQHYHHREQHVVDDRGRLQRPAAASSNARERDVGGGGGYGAPIGGSRGTNARGDDRGRRGGNDRGGGGGGRSHRGNNDYNSRASLPIEQGVVHTLLDKFGFILCADRDKELFFHYSEYKEGHSDELNIGDEVEFRLGKAEDRGRRGGGGGGDGEKWSAFDVRKLPQGTVYWEKEDEPGRRFRGTIDRVARDDSSRGGHRAPSRDRGRGGSSAAAVEGSIRIVVADEGEKEVDDENKTSSEIRYAASDYAKPKPGHARLERKDVVEFSLVTERRTGKKYARNIALVRSERERQREEREAKMLEDATLERGVVVGDKGDFGFLRSAHREEEVYFHASHVLPIEDGEDDAGRPALKEGQEVEFYVVSEVAGGGRKGKKLSARRMKLLPRGSVKFEHTIAEGVTGRVVDCPVGSAEPFGFGRRDDRKAGGGGGGNQPVGKIRLEEPITDDDGNEVTEVTLRPELYPGGTFAISRTGSEIGCWIRPNDVLLFDVVRKAVDGNCYATPTKYLHGPARRPEGWSADDVPRAKPAVRLVEPSLCGRAEGAVRSTHDNYAFVHLADRAADAYLPLFEVLPGEMQGDLARNDPYDVYPDDGEGVESRGGGRVNLEVGMEVAFDLSLQMLTNAAAAGGRGGGGRYGKQGGRPPQEKESLRARRVQILPKGTVKEKIALASGARATVTKEDPKQPFVGMLELDDSLKVESALRRHPLVAKLVEDISEGKYGEEATFHDVLCERDAHVVVSMVNAKDDLEWKYVPEDAAADSHSRKLCIFRKNGSDDDAEGEPEAVAKPPAAEASASSESSNGAGDKREAAEGKNQGVADDAASEEAAVAVVGKHDSHKKKHKKAKVVKSIRFDKFSFPDLSIGPLGVGDVVTCDIVQVRRSGAIVVENIIVVERKERPSVVSDADEDGKENTSQRKSLHGFVTEVVPNRQFGFITAVDNEGSKTGEHVFFHFKEVEQPSGTAAEEVAQDRGSSSLASRSKKPPGVSSDVAIRKGDEVKFEAGPGKNGKLNATKISILPRGTLKIAAKADKSSPTCTGYILMEPSHTTLANTPSHVVFPSGPAAGGGGAGGRWANVKDDKPMGHKAGSSAKEEGVILLLSDPSHLFSSRAHKENSPTKKDAAPAGEAALAEDAAVPEKKDTETESNTGTDAENGDGKGETKDDDHSSRHSAVGTHLRYKFSSVAHRSDGPRRGDLITFGKTRGAKLVKDIRVEKMAAANSVRGTLVNIDKDGDMAVFVSSENETRYEIKLTEVVSCGKSLLKDKEQVDGILHEGKIFGVCRTKDIFLASSIGRNSSGSSSGLKERPKLNLTVKKELQGMGGQIMAQSRMAKMPDGTNGFADGWTKRKSLHAAKKQEEEEEKEALQRSTSLSAAASEFVPNFPTAASGFDSDGGAEGP